MTSGDIVNQAVLHQAFYHSAHRISIYLSMPTSELSTTHIVHQALRDGKEVFVPYLHKSSESDRGPDGYLPARCMDMVKLRDWQDFEGLEVDRWNIPTVPDEGIEGRESILGGRGGVGRGKGEVEGLDLMLLPGVAFQIGKEGEVRRLGHGKGFYDFFLRRLRTGIEAKNDRSEGWPKLVGLALEEQLIAETEDELPMGENDQRLDSVVIGVGRILGAKETSWAQKYPKYSKEEVEAYIEQEKAEKKRKVAEKAKQQS